MTVQEKQPKKRMIKGPLGGVRVGV